MSNEQFINTLHPRIRPMARGFLAAAKLEGIDLKITFGMRTFAEQQALYDQGRTTPGKVVTKAKPGQSFHNYGLAIDVVPIVNGKADWNSKLWSKIGEIGKACGFAWGGDWKSFKDLPHFEYPPGKTASYLLHLMSTGRTDKDGFLIL